MRALGRPVLGYTNTIADYRERMEQYRRTATNVIDADNAAMAIEDFGGAENLMIEAAILASGGQVVRRSVPQGRGNARPRRLRGLPASGRGDPGAIAAGACGHLRTNAHRYHVSHMPQVGDELFIFGFLRRHIRQPEQKRWMHGDEPGAPAKVLGPTLSQH